MKYLAYGVFGLLVGLALAGSLFYGEPGYFLLWALYLLVGVLSLHGFLAVGVLGATLAILWVLRQSDGESGLVSTTPSAPKKVSRR